MTVEVAIPRPAAALHRFALPTLFASFGAVIASWASRIPALRQAAQLDHASLSLVLLCGGLGALLSWPVTREMGKRLSGRSRVLYAGCAVLAALLAIGMAGSMPALMAAVLLFGVTASCFDVAINTVATECEIAGQQSLMSRLHAFFCAGSLAGAMLGSAVASLAIPPASHFALVALALAPVLWMAIQALQDEAAEPAAKKFCLPKGPMVMLGALGFLAAVIEGCVAEWSGVFLRDHFHATEAMAPLALAAFTVMMLLARLCGDRLKCKYGARLLLAGGAALAAAGLFFAAFAPGPLLALAGFALAGLGLAVVFPFVFSAAGRDGPAALAAVATVAYSGSLAGPPVIGALAHHFGMQVALGFIAVLCICIALVSSRASMLH